MAMLPAFYLEGVARAGGVAVIVPPQALSEADAAEIVSRLDGLIVCGGRDIESTRYGQTPHQNAEVPDTVRDELEDKLLTAAIKVELPILGICRGAQMLNVNRGGTLIQHLPDVLGDNRYQLGGGVFTQMDLNVLPGTKLSQSVSNPVVSGAALYHHQAIDQLGDGLVISAKSPDGVVEGIELENYPFGVAVQWHPEQTLDNLDLFQALVAAAKAR
jgi:putative glutamine amidotransferase